MPYMCSINAAIATRSAAVSPLHLLCCWPELKLLSSQDSEISSPAMCLEANK